jgi:hypothetical protein
MCTGVSGIRIMCTGVSGIRIMCTGVSGIRIMCTGVSGIRIMCTGVSLIQRGHHSIEKLITWHWNNNHSLADFFQFLWSES